LTIGTAAGAVTRISDRIIDCPAKVIVISDADCVDGAAPALTMANAAANHTAFAGHRRFSDMHSPRRG